MKINIDIKEIAANAIRDYNADFEFLDDPDELANATAVRISGYSRWAVDEYLGNLIQELEQELYDEVESEVQR